MAVGILLLTHEAMGGALLAAARHVLGNTPSGIDVVEVAPNADLEITLDRVAARARNLDQGAGVLVLTDLYGSTPSNIGDRLSQLGIRMHRVSGLNLPMVLRVLNYPNQTLDELAQTAASGGRSGILIDHA
jgi:mannose PTS system EIIA component